MHTLLFVDDEPDIVDSLQRSFRKGYRVFGANSGADAMEIIDRESLDLIICDQRMPGITGDQVLKHALDKQPQAIRILLTGYATWSRWCAASTRRRSTNTCPSPGSRKCCG
ncbi:response regulator [Methylogaea oryzae]|uniref:response regulator n=1 Tax=Methylogaea oryzae TaxID=1295382 RepID=UPI0006D0D564|nr:response regulator [Methylogaea oryzae]